MRFKKINIASVRIPLNLTTATFYFINQLGNKMKFYRKLKHLKISALFFLCTLKSSNGNVKSPVITFERNSTAKWRNVTGEFSGAGFYSEKGEVLYASCSAPYPIKWEFDGFINPVSVLRIRELQRTFNPDKFTIKLAAFFNTAEKEPSLAASLRIRCEDLESFKKSEFSLYVKGNQNERLQSHKGKEIVDPLFIPCPTTTPLEPIHLFKLNGTEEVMVKDGVIYDPWRGFRKKNFGFFEEGFYICRQGSSEVNFTAKVSPQNQTVWFDPPNELQMTSDEKIFLSCSSEQKENQVKFKFEGDAATKLNISYVKNTTWDKAGIITAFNKKEKIFKGKISCLKDGVPFKEWNLKYIKAPEIFFDDYFSEMHCLTDFQEGDGVEVEAKSVRCSNAIGCSYYERCFEEGNVCDHLGQVLYSDKRRTKCAPLADRKVRNCVNLYYTTWNGVAQCKVDSFKKNWPYFTALNLHKYTDWRKVNESDLLRLEKDEGKPNGFRCTGVGFLFANSLAFELEYRNKSTELIQGEGNGGKVTIHQHPSTYKIQGFQVVSSLEVHNFENVKSVRCIAPFWNSTEVVKTLFNNL